MMDVTEAREYDRIAIQYLDILHGGFVETILNAGVRSGTVLEVGTGTGRIATELARHGSHLQVVGLDLSPVMLAVARENARNAGVENRVRFLIGDAKKIPFPDAAFDAVISHNMLHHLPEPSKLVDEAFRVAKPNGAVLIRDLVRPADWLVPLHVTIFGFRYHPVMKKGYKDSIHAGLTWMEWQTFAKRYSYTGAHLTKQFVTHATLQRLGRQENSTRQRLPGSVLRKAARRLYCSS
jgi:ubiquinone/menaquinone biosynthesis C-methylase UbiE